MPQVAREKVRCAGFDGGQQNGHVLFWERDAARELFQGGLEEGKVRGQYI